MGLFDGVGGEGGFDMEALMRMLNPMGTANAAEAPPIPPPGVGPNGAPQGGLTPDALLRSNPLPSPQPIPPPMEIGVGRAPPPGTGLPVPPPPNDIIRTGAPVVPEEAVPPPRESSLPHPREAIPASLSRGTGPAGVPPDDVGRALTGGGGTSGATDISAQAKDKAKADTLATALKGVVAPPAPVFQKLSSPSIARPTGTIKGDQLQALLMALNSGAPNLTRQLPTTLGK